jgi:Glutamine amidotransferase domain
MSDGTLILMAYQKWGQECPEHLIGDWCFGIWDKSRQTLFLARDHHGNTDRQHVLPALSARSGRKKRPDGDVRSRSSFSDHCSIAKPISSNTNGNTTLYL